MREWPQADLAARMSEQTGGSVAQSQIARIESGKRSVSVDDLMDLAAALNASPLDLLTPTDSDHPVTVGGTQHHCSEVRSWVRGFAPLAGQDSRGFAKAMPFDDRVFLADLFLPSYIQTAQRHARAVLAGNKDEARFFDADLEVTAMQMREVADGFSDEEAEVQDRNWAEYQDLLREQRQEIVGDES